MEKAKNPNRDTECRQQPKWAALVDDNVIPLPQQKLTARIIKTQASVANGKLLVRDHNSPHEIIIKMMMR